MNFSNILQLRTINTSFNLSKSLVLCNVQSVRSYKKSSLSILPRTNLITEFKDKIHDKNFKFSINDWRKLKEQLISSVKHIHEQNVDAVIISQCTEKKDLQIAKSYIKFLEKEGIQPNYATLGKLLKLYHLAYRNSEISEKDIEDVFKIYNKIRQERDLFDATTCENLVYGLLLTDKWKDSLELLEMTKLSASPSVNIYSFIVSKAFSVGEIEIGWKLFEEMAEAGKQPKCEVYISYVNNILKDLQTFVQNLEKLFIFLGKYELLLSKSVVTELKTILENQGNEVSLTALNYNGRCNICSSYMENISISDEEFKALSSAFLQRVLIRKDVFQKSTPEEVEHFINFVNRTGPFHCVIDGLNVAYSLGAKKSPKVYVHLLSSVVKHFQRQNKHVLVLGRKHMNKWPKDGIQYVKKNASVYFTNDLTQDDPFLLYATLKSGQMTDFFSRDLMRSHAYLLGPELKSIFQRWQQEHQYSLVTATDLGKVIVKEPIRFVKYAQKVNKIWHIPFKENYSANPAQQLDVPESWLCIKLNK